MLTARGSPRLVRLITNTYVGIIIFNMLIPSSPIILVKTILIISLIPSPIPRPS